MGIADKRLAMRLPDWVAMLPQGQRQAHKGPEVTEELVSSGVPRAVVHAYLDAVRRHGPNQAVWEQKLRWDLVMLAERHPELTLRAGLRWALLVAARVGVYNSSVLVTPHRWVEAGLGEDGWLFEAAGLSVEEARQVIEAGDEGSWDGVRVLAGLAGTPSVAF